MNKTYKKSAICFFLSSITLAETGIWFTTHTYHLSQFTTLSLWSLYGLCVLGSAVWFAVLLVDTLEGRS